MFTICHFCKLFLCATGSLVDTKMSGISNLSSRLQKLRSLMKNAKYVSEPLQAYVIPSEDAHQVCLIRNNFIRGEFY
jgi:hypothetical protein